MLSAGSFFRGKKDAAIKEKIPLTSDTLSSKIVSKTMIRKAIIRKRMIFT